MAIINKINEVTQTVPAIIESASLLPGNPYGHMTPEVDEFLFKIMA